MLLGRSLATVFFSFLLVEVEAVPHEVSVALFLILFVISSPHASLVVSCAGVGILLALALYTAGRPAVASGCARRAFARRLRAVWMAEG